jgi:aminoglycoside phosphotransferase family enzyme/predicted kinase
MSVDQEDVITWLSSPEAHRAQDDQDRPTIGDGRDANDSGVERIDTHASIIFLAGSHAFKLKRAVRYDYLDYSTVAKRRLCCAEEVRLNRRTAPMLYRGVQAVTRSSAGHFDLGGAGQVVDWLVVMNRFDRDAQLDERANRNALSLDLMPKLATAIAKLHAVAEWRFEHGGLAGLLWVVEGNRKGLQQFGDDYLDPTACEQLATTSLAIAHEHGDRLEARRAAGFVRHCHGDLHLGNICLIDGRPTLFDGVEFNAAIACVDVMYDLAFVLMDLLHRGLDQHANELFNGYLRHTDDLGSLGLLPLFLSLRAGVRTKTAETAAAIQPDTSARDDLRETARQYLALAQDLLVPRPAHLVAIGGGSGSGKSTLARSLAASIGPRPGAVVLRSDVERKRLLGVPLDHRLGTDGYTPGVTREVYRKLAEQAGLVLREGHAVVIDAVCGDPLERAMLSDVARSHGVPFSGLWLEAPLATLTARLESRTHDVSDATPRVAARQLEQDSAPDSWAHLNAEGDAQNVLRDARLQLERPSS